MNKALTILAAIGWAGKAFYDAFVVHDYASLSVDFAGFASAVGLRGLLPDSEPEARKHVV